MKSFAHLWLGILLGSVFGVAQAGDGWHHHASPYRAVFEVASQPNLADAGYFLQVPVCGLGDAGGKTVYAFDEKNRELHVQALGVSADNTALVQVRRDRGEPLKTIYAYWGGSRNAPQYTMMPPGLTLTIRTMPAKPDIRNWDGARKTWQASEAVGILPVEIIQSAENPLTADDAFIYEYSGAFLAAKVHAKTLFLVNDDAGYLLVDGKPVIDRSGAHRAHDNARAQDKTRLELKQGLTPFTCLVLDVGRHQIAVLAQFVTDKKKFVLPASAYVQPGKTKLSKVENRLKKQVCPAFRSRQLSYIGLDSMILTELELASWTGQDVAWKVGTGGTMKGATYRTIRVGTQPLEVQAAASRREVASGTIHLAEVPQRHRFYQAPHFQRYAETMLAEDLPSLDPVTLNGYYTFLDTQPRNPQIVPVCEAILKLPRNTAILGRLETLLTLARGAAADEPDKAAAAYQQALKLTREQAIILEIIEFYLYRRSDLETASGLLARAAKAFGENDRQVLRYQGELALLSGDHEAASVAFDQLAGLLTEDANYRQIAVLGNARIEEFHAHLRKGFLLEAEADLRELGSIAPELYGSGHYALLRAQMCTRLGWHTGAVAILEQTVGWNALPSFLPDMELARAQALLTLKREAEAQVLLKTVAETFPNHPVAPIARKLLTP